VELLEVLRCPFCRRRLDEDGDALACTGCGRSFGRAPDGIPLMLHAELPGAREKLLEAEGWLEKARSEGWYEPDDRVDAALPFVNRELGWNDQNWLANGHSFDVLLGRYILEARGLRVLEVGAAKAWAAPFWLERDCEFVATDILVDPKIGLGRGAFYGDFGRVQADGEHLPFADESFDVTYCVATLHHALDLGKMVREMARVTRRGGLVAGLNEGTRGVGRSADNPEQSGEKELGINEHVHTVWAYLATFTRAGVTVRRMERSDGWPPMPWGYFLSRVPKVGMTLGTLVHLSVGRYAGVSIYGRKR
jgi:SAM-dependent methyltransferase